MKSLHVDKSYPAVAVEVILDHHSSVVGVAGKSAIFGFTREGIESGKMHRNKRAWISSRPGPPTGHS